jgi:hypothetical protein
MKAVSIKNAAVIKAVRKSVGTVNRTILRLMAKALYL